MACKRRKEIQIFFPFFYAFSCAFLDFQPAAMHWRRGCQPGWQTPSEKQCLSWRPLCRQPSGLLLASKMKNFPESWWEPGSLRKTKKGTTSFLFIYPVLEGTRSSPWAFQSIPTDSRIKWDLPLLPGLTNSIMYNWNISSCNGKMNHLPCLFCLLNLSALSVLSAQSLCLSLLIYNSHSSQKHSRWPSVLLKAPCILLLTSTL